MWPINTQLDENGNLRHFLSIDGLNHEILTTILNTAQNFISVGSRAVKKVPLLRGKTIINLFFESSTRTRTTFELAAKRLSADVLSINVATSATVKGESLLDMLRNLEAMHCDMFVVRHNQSGAAHFISKYVAPHISVINAGDGCHAHPTQAMLDMFTIRKFKGDFSKLSIAIIGDVRHSRVARSQIQALKILGVRDLRVIAPKTLMPDYVEAFDIKVFHDINQGLEEADVIMMLRLQKERMLGACIPSAHEYFQTYGLTVKKLALAKPDAIVMHPGPINRGVEMDSNVADGPRSVILDQVTNGIAIRMAVMSMTLGRQSVVESVKRQENKL